MEIQRLKMRVKQITNVLCVDKQDDTMNANNPKWKIEQLYATKLYQLIKCAIH